MRLLLAASLALALSTPLAAQPATPDDAYLDPAARALVSRARERQESTSREIQAYQAVARERISVGMRALQRERLFFRRELAARIHWRRGEPGEIEILGGRQVLPAFTAGVKFAEGAEAEATSLVFDPARDNLIDTFFGGGNGWLRFDGNASNKAWLRSPLAPGAEAFYRFRSGDTTRLTLPDGTSVRLLELEVIPRSRDSRLLRGSIWFEANTAAPVRMIFRMARPFDLEMDSKRADGDGKKDADDVPGIFKPIRADMRFLTVEYALMHGRWWLPRLLAVDAIAEINTFPDVPVRYERAYSEFVLQGDSTAAGQRAAAAADSLPVLKQCPKPRKSLSLTISSSEGATAKVAQADSALLSDSTRVAVEPGQVCTCENGRCSLYRVTLAADTARLIASDYLPTSVYGPGEMLVTGESVDRLTERLRTLAPTPWGLEAPAVRLSGRRGEHLRYNRVEGLSVGARAEADFGAFGGDFTARIGTGDWQPELVLGAHRESFRRRLELTGYRRLTETAPATRALGFGNSATALLFGRDDGDYYRALGAELVLTPPRATPQSYRWRLFAERQSEAPKGTDWSLPRLFNRGDGFRPAYPAVRADQAGAELVLRTARGLNPTGLQWGAELGVLGSAGSFDFVRPSLTLGTSFPLVGGLVGSLEGAGGTAFGEVPPQSQWVLGGVSTLRGYAGAAAVGENFWRGRAEIANALPGARLVLFSDAGWAGPRDAVKLDDALLSAGIGASFLDGLIRADLARALRGERGWRMELYVGGRL
jgi:hypothetical protein